MQSNGPFQLVVGFSSGINTNGDQIFQDKWIEEEEKRLMGLPKATTVHMISEPEHRRWDLKQGMELHCLMDLRVGMGL